MIKKHKINLHFRANENYVRFANGKPDKDGWCQKQRMKKKQADDLQATCSSVYPHIFVFSSQKALKNYRSKWMRASAFFHVFFFSQKTIFLFHLSFFELFFKGQNRFEKSFTQKIIFVVIFSIEFGVKIFFDDKKMPKFNHWSKPWGMLFYLFTKKSIKMNFIS